MDPLSVFSPATRAWFERTFDAPTPPQELGWPAIATGAHVLIQAPTGSGKTLTAFLYAIDRLTRDARRRAARPLRLAAEGAELRHRAQPARAARRARVAGCASAVRTGDTPAKERRELVKEPPDILITTPESLYLMLTSQARETLRGVETLILDEVHAVAGTKRGAHLALSRRAARSARRRARCSGSGSRRRSGRSRRSAASSPAAGRSTLVDAGTRKELDLEVVVPVEDMRELGSTARSRPGPPTARSGRGTERGAQSIWPSIYPELLRLVARAPLDDRLRQQPPPRRAARAAPQRARRARRSRAPTTARSRASSACSSRRS